MKAILTTHDNFDLARGPFAPRVWGRTGTIWERPAMTLCAASAAVLQWTATPDDRVLAVPGSIERSDAISEWLAANPKKTSWRRS
jgi:hypothetical protein